MSQSERLPWCENCKAYSNPTEDKGVCGECGGQITWIQTNE